MLPRGHNRRSVASRPDSTGMGPFIDRAHARNAIPEQIGTVVTVAAHQGVATSSQSA